MNSAERGRVFLFAAALAACAAFFAPARSDCEGLSKREIESHLMEAEESFRRAIELDRSDPAGARDYYQRSILHFERIAADGAVGNGRLYYNIGNTYFRLGDLGRAILNYKRAFLYAPNDPNLRQNIEYARSRRLDKIEKKERERILKTLFFLHYDIPSGVRLLVFTISFACSWTAAAILLFVRRGGIKTVLIVSAVIAALFLSSLSFEAVTLASRPEGVIVALEVVARKGDAVTYQPSFTEPLHAGSEFTLVGRRPDWWQIELESGAKCWVPEGSVELVVE